MFRDFAAKLSARGVAVVIVVAWAGACSGSGSDGRGFGTGGTFGATGGAGGSAPDGGGASGSGGSGGSGGLIGSGGGATTCPEILCGSPAVCCESGEECVEGACAPACASGVRCGADSSTCCNSGEVCISDVCESPGGPCTDSFDCAPDEFCEPTLGQCLPQLDPLDCTFAPTFSPFDPIVEWSVTTAVDRPDCLHAITAPVVIDLDGDEKPEVIANFACDSDWQVGILRAFRGTDGSPLWSLTSLEMNGRTSIAAGDVDGDGAVEIYAVGRLGDPRLHSIDASGNVTWSTMLSASANNGAPSLADLDMDGVAEIVLGAAAYRSNGSLYWEMGTGPREGTNGSYTGGISAIADIDGDGMPEVVAGRNAYEHDGTPKWTTVDADGYPAIANFDADAQPEIVIVTGGTVRYVDGLDGSLEWGPVTIPGGGIGGPPTIADFDGDGLPEIGVAGAMSYSVYDPDGPSDVLWSMATQDQSSNATGSSVFDFEGDGAAEVVYADECYMRVYRGTDGTVLVEIPSSSATIHEYPLVADVDADGNSEILIVANARAAGIPAQCTAGNASWNGDRKGLFVYGDSNDRWVRTRRIWNQHAYHVTNVDSVGRVPATEGDNWALPNLNNYRQNVQGEGVFNAPDLAVDLEISLSGCPIFELRARVKNQGALGAPSGIDVSFYRGSSAMGTLLATMQTTRSLLPGESEVVSTTFNPAAGSPPFEFYVAVDGASATQGIVEECLEDNNEASSTGVDCSIPR